MANYFVSLTGNDGNAGTELAPFRTFSKGVSMLSSPGDMLLIRGGTWNNTRLYVDYKNGNSSNPIIVQNYPGEQVILDYNNARIGGEWEGAVHIQGGNYVTIKGNDVGGQKGIVVKRANQRGVCVYTTGGNCGFNGVHAEYSFHNGIFIDYGTDCFIEYCYATENAWDNNGTQVGNIIYTNASGVTWSGGIGAGTFANPIIRPVIRGCVARRNRGEGIGMFGLQYGGTIEDCISYDNYSVNIYPDSVTGVTVQRNIVYQTTNSYLRTWGSPGNSGTPYLDGILTANEQAGKECKNMVIVNNLVRNGGIQVVAWAMNGASTVSSNNYCAHNTSNYVSWGAGPQTNGTLIEKNYTGSIVGGDPNSPASYVPTSLVSTARTSRVLVDYYGNLRHDPTITGAIEPSGSTPEQNLALNKFAVASSEQFVDTPASYAVDGNSSSRWGSVLGIDPQWIQIDLGANYTINSVIINWEAAYASSYEIQMSYDSINWTPIYSTTSGTGGTVTHSVSGIGRYIRIYGTVRGTAWGYSIWELQVYGSAAQITIVPYLIMEPF